MENLLASFTAPDTGPTDLLTRLIAALRQRDADDFEFARQQLETLCTILDKRPELRETLRSQLAALSECKRHSDLYTSAGTLPNTGFFTEIFRRIGHKMLPEATRKMHLRSALRKAFHMPSDAEWVIGVGEDTWLKLIEALRFDERPAADRTSVHPVDQRRMPARQPAPALAAQHRTDRAAHHAQHRPAR